MQSISVELLLENVNTRRRRTLYIRNIKQLEIRLQELNHSKVERLLSFKPETQRDRAMFLLTNASTVYPLEEVVPQFLELLKPNVLFNTDDEVLEHVKFLDEMESYAKEFAEDNNIEWRKH